MLDKTNCLIGTLNPQWGILLSELKYQSVSELIIGLIFCVTLLFVVREIIRTGIDTFSVFASFLLFTLGVTFLIHGTSLLLYPEYYIIEKIVNEHLVYFSC